MMKTRARVLGCLLAGAATAAANNVEVSAPAIMASDPVANTVTFQFDLAWENSWRTSTLEANWDAVWVFIKYKIAGQGLWRHARLAAGGHGAPPGATLNVPGDRLGAFVHRSGDGIGDVEFDGVTLVWDYGVDLISDNDAIDNLEYAIHAIEMVYIPEGAFDLGDIFSTDSFFEVPPSPLQLRKPYRVTSEAAITVSPMAGDLYYAATAPNAGDQAGPIPASFPKGFQAFYCMKYELTVGQYVAFLNALTYDQQVGRTNPSSPAGTRPYAATFPRIGIEILAPGVNNTAPAVLGVDYNNDGTLGDGEDVPMLPVLVDLLAYLDWAGLRPLTELEFEKACRGTEPASIGEYAWGNSSLHTAGSYTVSNEGTAAERLSSFPSTGNGVCLENQPNFSVGTGPLRAGCFAAKNTPPNREEAGGSYYGVMELSGNMGELVISTGSTQARQFDGSHGDGDINTAPANWLLGEPAIRGGRFDQPKERMRVSDRYFASVSVFNSFSGRGGRTAP